MSSSLDRLKESHGVSVQWRSFELRPAGSPPIPEHYKKQILARQPEFNAMAEAQYGLKINRGPFGIDSRPALIGAKYAEAHGKGDDYHAAIFRAYWQEARDISDLEVLADIAETVGLDRKAFLAALDNPELQREVDVDIMQAGQAQISGVPALVFANKYLIPGAQPYEELVKVVAYVRDREGDNN